MRLSGKSTNNSVNTNPVPQNSELGGVGDLSESLSQNIIPTITPLTLSTTSNNLTAEEEEPNIIALSGQASSEALNVNPVPGNSDLGNNKYSSETLKPNMAPNISDLSLSGGCNIGGISEGIVVPGKYLNETYETISKNLKSYPNDFTYGVDGVSTIVYYLGDGLSITKTFNYTLGVLTNIDLSGDTPSGINIVKTFNFIGDNLVSITYS